jgi:hypothetical protein
MVEPPAKTVSSSGKMPGIGVRHGPTLLAITTGTPSASAMKDGASVRIRM